MHVDDAIDGILDAIVDARIGWPVPEHRHVVVVEQRHGAAGRLLDAAERILVERPQQSRDVDAGNARQRGADLGGAGGEGGDHVAIDRRLVPGAEARDGIDGAGSLRRPHLDVPFALNGEVAGPLDGDGHFAEAGIPRPQRPGQQLALIGGQPLRLVHRPLERDRARGRQRDAIVAGLTIDIVQRQRHPPEILRGEEARQHRIRGNGIAHEQALLARAHAVPVVGDGHEPQLTDEIGDVEGDLRLALVVEFHRAAEQCHGARRDDVESADLAGIAAGPDAPEFVGPGVEQAAVIVAHGDAETTLAEIVAGGIGRLVAGELQDAFVDGGQRDERVLAGLQVGHLHRHLDALARRDLLGRADLNAERAQGRIEAEPYGADRPGGRAFGGGRQWPPGRDEGIGACAPFGLDRDFDGRPSGRHLHRLGRDDAVGGDGDERLSGERRFDAQAGAFARRVVLPVAGDAQRVGRFLGRGAAIPAHVEGEARGGVLLVVDDGELVLAPIQALRQTGRGVGLKRDLVGGHQPRVGDRLPAPAAVDLEPLIGVDDALDAVFDRRAGDLRPSGIDRHDIELGVDSLTRIAAFERGGDAEVGVARADRHDLVRLGRATAARFEDSRLDLRAQGQDGVLGEVAAPFEARLAGLVGVLALQLDERRFEFFTLLLRAEPVFGEGRERRIVDRNAHLAFDGEVRCGRAIEEVRGQGEAVQGPGPDDRLFGCKFDLEFLGDEILDRKFDPAHGCALWVDMCRYGPAAAPRGFRQVDCLRNRAGTLQGVGEAGELAAVGALDDQGDGQVGKRVGCIVAHQRHELHRLTGAIDAALGIEEGVDRAGLRASIDTAIR